MKKRSSIFLLLFLLLILGAVPVAAEEAGPTLSTTNMTLNVFGLTKYEDVFYPEENNIQILNLNYESVVNVLAPSGIKVTGGNGNYSIYPKRKGLYDVVFEIDQIQLHCKVNVISAHFKRNKRSLSDDDSQTWIPGRTMLALKKGEKATLKVKGIDGRIKWRSSDKSVAKVSQTGEVTGKGYGYATITAKSKDTELTYEVGVSYDVAIGALQYAVKNYHSQYSQPKRTVKGYYDCSSYVWFSYKSQGITFGSNAYPPTAANIAKWCTDNGFTILEGNIEVSKLLPGDLIFLTGADNGRYKGIYHVDLFQGNYSSMTVARQKFYWELLDRVMVARPSSVTAEKPIVKSAPLSAQLKWRESYGASGYIVYRSDSETGTYKKIGKAKKIPGYNDTKAELKKTYYYKVLPYWSSKKVYFGSSSNQGFGQWKKASPEFSVNNDYGGISVSWEPVAGATEYQVLRKKTSGKWKTIATIKNKKATSYLDSSVKNDKKYCYTLIAIKKSEKSLFNKKGTKLKYIEAPEIEALTSTAEGMEIRWKKVKGAKNYQICRKTSSGDLQILGTTKQDAFLDKDVENGESYTYIVRCVSADGKTMISGYNKNGAAAIYESPLPVDVTGDQLTDGIPQL